MATCHKHGEYKIGSDYFCPTCTEVQEKALCAECEKHKATINFADSVISSIHGFNVMICRCCYLKKVEKAYNDIHSNYNKLKEEVQREGCQ